VDDALWCSEELFLQHRGVGNAEEYELVGELTDSAAGAY
jgi:hypothetical protein